MQAFRTLIRVLALAALIFPPSIRAAQPDPVRFGLAIEAGDVDAARRWLDEGMSPDFMADRIGTGLMIAAWEGNLPMMELFLGRGARVDAVNRFGEQALQLAAWQGHVDAVRWLLDHGAAINRDGREWGALHYAAFAGNTEIARLLIQRGADVNARVPNAATALMMAAHEGHEDMAKLLLDAGADPSLVNDRGDSALTWAMRYGNLRIAKLVSSADQFAMAVKLPPASFGAPRQALPAVPRFDDILRQIRIAQAEGLPLGDLRKSLFDAIAQFKQGSKAVNLGSKRAPVAPKALVITARRSTPGEERAEIVYAGVASAAAPAAALRAAPRDIAEILRQLQAAQAEGKPTAELRKAFHEAVDNFKKQGADPK